MNKQVLVAIHCLVYNHEPYIRDCLDGFVMQKTNFKFVAIVHDDASTDGTAAIIREYAEKYPEIICPILETENQWSRPDGSLGRIMSNAIDKTGAKYVAMCEGDDYWIDAYKLQKQVDFMENNPNYSMCFHAAEIKDECDCNEYHPFTIIKEKEYDIHELYSKWIVAMASIIYKRDIVKKYEIYHPEWMITGDVCLVMKCASVGKVYGMSDIMSVYRLNCTSLVHSKQYQIDKIMKHPRHFLSFYYSFPNLREPIRWNLAHSYYSRARKGNGNIFSKLSDIIHSLYYNPKIIMSKLFK